MLGLEMGKGKSRVQVPHHIDLFLNLIKESKFLGVLIDKTLSWRGHIDKVRTQIKKTIGIIGRARGFMNGPQLLLLYNTMVLPYLLYCLLIFFEFVGNRNILKENPLNSMGFKYE